MGAQVHFLYNFEAAVYPEVQNQTESMQCEEPCVTQLIFLLCMGTEHSHKYSRLLRKHVVTNTQRETLKHLTQIPAACLIDCIKIR